MEYLYRKRFGWKEAWANRNEGDRLGAVQSIETGCGGCEGDRSREGVRSNYCVLGGCLLSLSLKSRIYRRILGPVYDNEKENWRILTNKEIYASVKKPTIIETIRLNRLHWFGHVQRTEENRIPKMVLHMNLGTTKLRCRPRNRGQEEVWEDGRIVGREGWQEKVHDREEWKKLLRTARNCRILHMPMEWINLLISLFHEFLTYSHYVMD